MKNQGSPIHVIKAGGAVLAQAAVLNQLARDIARYVRTGSRVILVHGGGSSITELHEKVGLETTKQNGLRVTPPESMDLVAMVLRGQANLIAVRKLNSLSVPAIGLSGADLSLLRSSFLNEEVYGRVGRAPEVDSKRLLQFMSLNLVPVIAPVCLAPDGGLVNVNADSVARAIAVSLNAQFLDFVSDVPGVYDDCGEALTTLRGQELGQLLAQGQFGGGMLPKLQASLAAIQGGVARVRIGNLKTLANNQATEVVLQ